MVTGLSLALIAHWHREMGVFAVALQPLAAQIVGNVVIYRRHPLQPPRAFHLQTATMMFNYGWKVTLAQYVNNLQQSVVNAFVLVVGGVIGSGVFGRATQVSDMVGFNLMVSFDRLLHPLMRSVREDRDRLRSIFVRGCIGSMLLCGFGWAWLVGTAPDLIRVVMGPQWHAVPPVLRTVTIALFTAGLSTMSVIVVHALGKPLIWLRFALVNLVALAIAAGLVTLFGGGLVSMAAVFAITQACTAVGMFVWAIRTIHLPAGPLIGHLARLIFASGATCGCIFLVDHAHWPLVVRLIISSMVGVAVLLGIVLVIDREAITTFRDLLPRRVAATEPAASPEASETGELFGRLPNRS
jgi:O-antigen/teichoic acid export membrane protein